MWNLTFFIAGSTRVFFSNDILNFVVCCCFFNSFPSALSILFAPSLYFYPIIDYSLTDSLSVHTMSFRDLIFTRAVKKPSSSNRKSMIPLQWRLNKADFQQVILTLTATSLSQPAVISNFCWHHNNFNSSHRQLFFKMLLHIQNIWNDIIFYYSYPQCYSLY